MAKGRISKQVFRENKARQISEKRKFLRFEIRPFALLPTNTDSFQKEVLTCHVRRELNFENVLLVSWHKNKSAQIIL